MIRVFLDGPHSRRTPLSYPALAPLFAGAIERVADPARADLLIFAHVLDIEDAPAAAVAAWRARRRPVVLLSEEPFWDTIWGRRPLEREIVVATRHGDLPVIQLNHHTSGIYRFAAIPYYLLTNHRFAAAYAYRFRRNAARTPADWRARFAGCPRDIAFLFERRPERHHDVAWPEAGLFGLCAWRTDLAEACAAAASVAGAPERVALMGASWQGGRTRFELPDWHLDKLVGLDGQARMIGAIENTHHPDYLTEKLFDAFACGARPLYLAAPEHRVHGLGLPAASWINLHGLTPAAAAARLCAPEVGDAVCEAYAGAQRRLAALFGDPGLVVAERARLRRALLAELRRVLDGG